MMREWKLRLLPLALVAFVAAGCGDDGTEPGGNVDDFDPQTVAASPDAVMAVVSESWDAQSALVSFLTSRFVGAEFDRERPAPALARLAGRVRATPAVGVLQMTTSAPVAADIPPELQGNTFALDPETFEWVADPERADEAPDAGVRIIYYQTTEEGEYVLPLAELGHIDLEDATVAGLDGISVNIVRTVGGNTNLADFALGYGWSETETTYSVEFVLDGYFSDGSDQVDILASAEESGADGSSEYATSIDFDGPEGGYSWNLSGSDDWDTGAYQDTYEVRVTQGTDVTLLEVEVDGLDTEDGAGTLKFNGTTVANLVIEEDELSFTKPGGGSFTAQEEQRLLGVVAAMVSYGPAALYLFFLFFFVLAF